MALYVDGLKYNFILGENIYNMYVNTSIPVTNGVRLLSSDDYVLKDVNDLYLTVIEYMALLSLDGDVLQDSENNYLTIKKG